MTPIRPNGPVTVTMAIALLAIEAITVMGVARIVAWWDGPRPATLARAGATAWGALTRSAVRAAVQSADAGGPGPRTARARVVHSASAAHRVRVAG